MKTISFLLLLLFSQVGLTSNALLEFSNSMYSFTADFTQTVYDSDSVVLQENKGQVQLMRPGKFRWTYNEPFKQIIVADGLSLWVYDEDIAQVTVRPQRQTLGSAPIGLLSGQRALQTEFDVIFLGDRDGLQWFQLEPIVNDTDFQRVFIALDASGLRAMELRDSFEQATQIRFSNFRKNVNLDNEVFVFTPPPGADVVGEAGVAEDAGEENLAPESSITQPEIVDKPALAVEPSADRPGDDDLLGPADPDATETTTTAEQRVTAENELQGTTAGNNLAATLDEQAGSSDGDSADGADESEVFFQVIETIKVPVE